MSQRLFEPWDAEAHPYQDEDPFGGVDTPLERAFQSGATLGVPLAIAGAYERGLLGAIAGVGAGAAVFAFVWRRSSGRG